MPRVHSGPLSTSFTRLILPVTWEASTARIASAALREQSAGVSINKVARHLCQVVTVDPPQRMRSELCRNHIRMLQMTSTISERIPGAAAVPPNGLPSQGNSPYSTAARPAQSFADVVAVDGMDLEVMGENASGCWGRMVRERRRPLRSARG